MMSRVFLVFRVITVPTLSDRFLIIRIVRRTFTVSLTFLILFATVIRNLDTLVLFHLILSRIFISDIVDGLV